jgi:hypothetical protein
MNLDLKMSTIGKAKVLKVGRSYIVNTAKNHQSPRSRTVAPQHPAKSGGRPEDQHLGAAGVFREPRQTSLTFFNGRLRIGLPVAAKIALSTAGAATQIVGSPTPPQKSWVGTITVSTLGNSARRMIS